MRVWEKRAIVFLKPPRGNKLHLGEPFAARIPLAIPSPTPDRSGSSKASSPTALLQVLGGVPVAETYQIVLLPIRYGFLNIVTPQGIITSHSNAYKAWGNRLGLQRRAG